MSKDKRLMIGKDNFENKKLGNIYKLHFQGVHTMWQSTLLLEEEGANEAKEQLNEWMKQNVNNTKEWYNLTLTLIPSWTLDE